MAEEGSLLKELYVAFLKDNWKLYIMYLITLISLPLQSIAMPHYYGEVINSLKDKNLAKSKYLFGVLLGIWVLIQAFSIGISYVDNYIWPKFHAYIRQFFFNLIVDRYNQNYQELEIGSILTKLIKLPWILDDVSNQIQRFLLTNSILIISNFIYLYRHHYSLGFMYLGCIAVVFIMSRLYFNTCNANIKKVEQNYDNCHEEIEDTLQNLLSIYTSKKIPDEKARIEKINEETRHQQYITGICNRKFRIYFSIINVFLFLGLNYVAFTLFIKGKIAVAALVSIFILNYTILGSLITLYDSAKDFMNVKSHVELIQKFIDELPNTDVSKQTKKIPNPEKGLDIVFKDIEYTHNSAKEKLFDKLNLRIRPFEKVAILGTVGSGKSSVVSLISALQKFQGGNIFINETPITEIDIINLRENIIYIPQRPKLFNRTLRENLTYGLPSNVSVENIFKFMNDNGFTELEKIFRKRLDDKVGKNGSKFSGGQLAMIWFLRAAMQKAQLIITDEASAALDPQSRKQIKKMIDIIAKDKSIIVITHDDEMTIGMDRIITFEKGKIISDIKGNKNSNNNNNNGNRWN
jgi:ABC-type bacteriocin/lantibiotic exporter with double-glycine peptidase domain